MDGMNGCIGRSRRRPRVHRPRIGLSSNAGSTAFRAEYNCERPHQALGQLTPAALYQPSARRWPAWLEDPWYDADHQVRRVRREGAIKWMGQAIFISEALSGELLGIRELPWGDYLVRFANLALGLIRPGESRLRRIRAHARLRFDAALLLPQLSSMYPV